MVGLTLLRFALLIGIGPLEEVAGELGHGCRRVLQCRYDVEPPQAAHPIHCIHCDVQVSRVAVAFDHFHGPHFTVWAPAAAALVVVQIAAGCRLGTNAPPRLLGSVPSVYRLFHNMAELARLSDFLPLDRLTQTLELARFDPAEDLGHPGLTQAELGRDPGLGPTPATEIPRARLVSD
jgi:hypothetical protein